MSFRSFQHIERIGNDAVEGIEKGKCFIFYKIDGTNGSVWLENGELHCGSRNRELSLEKDNAGFMDFILKNKEKYLAYLKSFPSHRLYMEWLVPHTLKNYVAEAWHKPYIFDVFDEERGEYLSYEEYSKALKTFSLDYIPPICICENPTEKDYEEALKQTNKFLVIEGSGLGEGIVIKNYAFKSKYRGEQLWGKIINEEFRTRKQEPKEEGTIEERIVEKFLTPAMIEKEFNKILERGAWNNKRIGELLGVVWHEFIVEEAWDFIKFAKEAEINFKKMHFYVNEKIKKVKRNLF